ncbi:MAG: TIGR01212 family radical SAM protein [Clostridia bacterium]|nr:TIGR01212 family radical SAM protein [Clostridia bacterium]
MKQTQKDLNPFEYSDSNKRYHTMDYYMRRRFGQKACKVPIDGGFTCPNRDGSKGVGGCAFCSENGSGDFTAGRAHSITEQIDIGAEMMRKKWAEAILIPYFQSYTNTYAPLSVLKERYEEALSHPLASGLCIATRADCITPEIAEYLRELSKKHFIMLELGLQTSNDVTAQRINRCHSFEDFRRGYDMVRDLFTCVHIINGLIGETKSDMLRTAKDVAALRPSAVKIHLLHVIKGTETERQYLSGELETMSLSDYVSTVCDQLELLPKETVIERVTGDGSADTLVAPLWSKKKLVVQNEIDKELLARGSYQGAKFWCR